MDLAEREGHEPHVPVGAVGQAGEDVLVGVAGERAAVVPGDGEWLHDADNARRGAEIPVDHRGRGAGHELSVTGPSVAPMAAPTTTSDAWCMRTWTRLQATTRGQPEPQPRPASAGGVRAGRGGEEGGAGVAAREAAREGRAQLVGPSPGVVDRPAAGGTAA